LTTTTAALNSSSQYAYSVAFLPAGTYTLAFTCDPDDPSVAEDTLSPNPIHCIGLVVYWAYVAWWISARDALASDWNRNLFNVVSTILKILGFIVFFSRPYWLRSGARTTP
jgi:hypothetical protein